MKRATSLPATRDADNVGRATSGSAYAYLGFAYLPKEENVCGTGANFPGMRIEVLPAAGEKCPRCWMHSTEANAEGLCPRCARVVAGLTLD